MSRKVNESWFEDNSKKRLHVPIHLWILLIILGSIAVLSLAVMLYFSSLHQKASRYVPSTLVELAESVSDETLNSYGEDIYRHLMQDYGVNCARFENGILVPVGYEGFVCEVTCVEYKDTIVLYAVFGGSILKSATIDRATGSITYY